MWLEGSGGSGGGERAVSINCKDLKGRLWWAEEHTWSIGRAEEVSVA